MIRDQFYKLIFFLTLFGLYGCCDAEKIPEMMKGLYSKLPKERNNAALGLASCGEASAEAVPRLSKLLYDENVGVQSAASYALRKIDTPEARAAIEEAEKR